MIEKYLTVADLLFAIYGTTILLTIYVISALNEHREAKKLRELIELHVLKEKNK